MEEMTREQYIIQQLGIEIANLKIEKQSLAYEIKILSDKPKAKECLEKEA